MVEEQLGDVAQVLAVLPLEAAVDLEHADVARPVDLVARGVALQARLRLEAEHG